MVPIDPVSDGPAKMIGSMLVRTQEKGDVQVSSRTPWALSQANKALPPRLSLAVATGPYSRHGLNLIMELGTWQVVDTEKARDTFDPVPAADFRGKSWGKWFGGQRAGYDASSG